VRPPTATDPARVAANLRRRETANAIRRSIVRLDRERRERAAIIGGLITEQRATNGLIGKLRREAARLQGLSFNRPASPTAPVQARVPAYSYLAIPWPERMRMAQARWARLTPAERAAERREQHQRTLGAVQWLEDHRRAA
jgi:hypothetical protein